MKRKSLLIAIAAISLMALVGLGTNAEFSDIEGSDPQSFTAGTLDLEVGGGAGTFPITVGNTFPGDSGTASLVLTNTGTIAGQVLTADVTEVAASDQEVSCTEPEAAEPDEDAAIDEDGCAAPGDGELDNVLSIEIKDGATTLFSGTLADWLAQAPVSIAGGLGANGGTKTLTINYSIPTSAGNEIQSDTAGFSMNFVLEQLA